MGTLGEGHSYTSYPKTLMRQLVYVVTFTSTVMLGVAFFLNLQIPPKYIGNVIVTGVGILTIIALKRGDPLNLGVVPLILTIFASASFKVYISGEMQPFDYSGYTIMIFISAFVLSRVYYWLLTATATGTLATIYVLQLFSDNQQIAIGQLTLAEINELILIVLIFIATAMVSRYIVQNLTAYRTRIHSQTRELQQRNATLEQAKTQIQQHADSLTLSNDRLHRSEQELRTVLTSMPDLILEIDRDGVVLRNLNNQDWETAAPEIKLTNRNIREFLSPADVQRGLVTLQNTLTLGSIHSLELQLSDDTANHPFYFDVRLAPLKEKHTVLAIVRPTTEARLAEEALQQAQRLDSIGLLAGGIAHDFNNLLLAIQAQSAVGLAKLEDNHKARKHLERIQKSTNRAAKLTQQLLAYAGKGQAELRPIKLNALIQENIDLLRSIVPESSSFHIELAPNLPNIVGDPSQIQQVVMNLVINAAEAAAHSNAPVKVQTQVVNLEHPPPQAGFVTPILDSMVGSFIRLDVQDRGTGIAPENLRKIFDPFFTTKENGKGLGLSATLGIVNAHNGALFVQSQPNEGCHFAVYLPAAQGTAASPTGLPASHQLNMQIEIVRESVTGSVLVVDDQEEVRESLLDIFETITLPTIAAHNGQHALSLYDSHHDAINLVVTDIRMPEMDGIRLVEQLWQRDPHLKIILVSGYTNTAIPLSYLSNPNLIFLPKPFDIEKFTLQIADLFNSASRSI